MNAKKKQRINERGFEMKLAALLGRVLDRRGGAVSTFEEHGVLTDNRGLVVTRCRCSYRASSFLFEDAMIEYHALKA